MSTIVNSWNEWDPLKHVIVGRADDCHIPPEEPALDAKVPEDSDMRGQWGRRPQDSIDRANELLDNESCERLIPILLLVFLLFCTAMKHAF